MADEILTPPGEFRRQAKGRARRRILQDHLKNLGEQS